MPGSGRSDATGRVSRGEAGCRDVGHFTGASEGLPGSESLERMRRCQLLLLSYGLLRSSLVTRLRSECRTRKLTQKSLG